MPSADVVLGQAETTSEGPAAGGRGPENGLHLPTGVLVHEGRLVVADAWHHRVLVWDSVPTAHDTPPDHVLGQPDLSSVDPNAGGDADAGTFYWPFGIAMIGGRFHVADTGNRRVLIWDGGLPEPGRPADVVLGQPDPRGARRTGAGRSPPTRSVGRTLSRRRPTGPCWWPTRETTDCCAGTPRPTATARPMPSSVSPTSRAARSSPMSPSQPDAVPLRHRHRRRRPGRRRHRQQPGILIQPGGAVADRLEPLVSLGQPDLAANGENRWEPGRRRHPLLALRPRLAQGRRATDLLAIADSGNNRVVVWEFSRAH